MTLDAPSDLGVGKTVLLPMKNAGTILHAEMLVDIAVWILSGCSSGKPNPPNPSGDVRIGGDVLHFNPQFAILRTAP